MPIAEEEHEEEGRRAARYQATTYNGDFLKRGYITSEIVTSSWLCVIYKEKGIEEDSLHQNVFRDIFTLAQHFLQFHTVTSMFANEARSLPRKRG